MGVKVPLVFIVNGDNLYAHMFTDEGWAITDRLSEADLVQFCGGSDVNPALYGEPKHATTYCNLARDRQEQIIYEAALAKKIPMAGICRGGQFLNVMNNGMMWQDVDAHAIQGTHEAFDHLSGKVVRVSSTHHQMMRPTDKGFILLTARRSSRKEKMGQSGAVIIKRNDTTDIEAVYYDDTRCLCYQPHPEFGGPELVDCRDLYFEYISYYLGVRAEGEGEVCVG